MSDKMLREALDEARLHLMSNRALQADVAIGRAIAMIPPSRPVTAGAEPSLRAIHDTIANALAHGTTYSNVQNAARDIRDLFAYSLPPQDGREVDDEADENCRLTHGLIAINQAGPSVTADAMRSVAYDIAFNSIPVDVAEFQLERRSTPPAPGADRAAVIEECLTVVGNMRQSEAGLFDAKHSGQRGCDRADALYDAYVAIRALAPKGAA